ncbi:MAG TPA: hypothetical protein VH081_00815 [Solirubrobacteraceae bacterium]|jgi:hypothetical protein|nr:hypothetical protein [Solirubrobacteraceae bacterium]
MASLRLDPSRLRGRRIGRRARECLSLVTACALLAAAALPSSVPFAAAAASADVSAPSLGGAGQTSAPEKEAGSSLEAAAAKAGDTGRAVAMSLIGLAFAVAATVLAFKRDFKEAAGVFAVGIVSVLLATPTGVSLLRDTVKSVFGG